MSTVLKLPAKRAYDGLVIDDSIHGHPYRTPAPVAPRRRPSVTRTARKRSRLSLQFVAAVLVIVGSFVTSVYFWPSSEYEVPTSPPSGTPASEKLGRIGIRQVDGQLVEVVADATAAAWR